MVLLLALIYLIFISLGLPDSLFGAAWPIMHLDFGVNESFASIYMIITAIGSGGMSFIAGPLIRRFGTGIVTIVSVFLTAAGMLLIGFSSHIAIALVGSIIMGLGAGAIDTGLNSYVSTHYKASHMNWLHAFWGVGVTLSPLIMSIFLDNANNWQGGYRCVSYIQFGIFFIALLSLPLWLKYDNKSKSLSNMHSTVDNSTTNFTEASTQEIVSTTKENDTAIDSSDTNKQSQNQLCVNSEEQNASLNEKTTKIAKLPFFVILRNPAVLLAVVALGLYTAMEFLIGTWGASYAVNVKGVSAAVAARWISLYYGGIMLGRVLSGFLSYKLCDQQLIRCGVIVMLVGMLIFALPIGEYSLIGLLMIGIGFGPIFPSTIHCVPIRFGETYTADITGIQMGGSYAIGWVVQLAFGFTAPATTFAFMPYLLICLAALMFVCVEFTNKLTQDDKYKIL